MKREKKIGLIAVVALLVLIAGIVLVRQATKTPIIAFYDIDEKTQTAIEAVAGNDFSIVTYTETASLESQLRKKKPDIVIVPSGIAVQQAKRYAHKGISVDASALGKMTSSIRSAIPHRNDGSAFAIPLLSGGFEIDINMNLARSMGMRSIATWRDIERFIVAADAFTNGEAKVAFAGKDGALVLDLLGALTEAFGGKPAYDNAVALLKDAVAKNNGDAPNMDTLARQLAEESGAPLYNAVQFLANLYRKNLLVSGCFTLEKSALPTYMQADLVSVTFMSLSDHRTIARNAIESFNSSYFPSDNPASSRNFTATIVYAVPLKKNKKTQQFLQELVAVEAQEALSRKSGLAPVLAECDVPDRQAEEARLWVAATNAPLAGLSREVALSPEERDMLAASLLSLVRAQ